jgi:capsular polysaccharide export protein
MNARLDANQLARYRHGDYTLPGYYHLLQCRRVLMLQGPMGNFFNRVAAWLEQHDIDVRKINFNGGDWFFHRKLNATDFRGALADFPRFLKCFIDAHDIDGIVCFGDCRQYHVAAKQVADMLGVPFFVFEEGYVRPDYITLECGGVNVQSLVPRSAAFYRSLPEIEIPKPKPASPSFRRGAVAAMVYYAAGRLLRASYPKYRHHKKFSIRYEARAWVRSWIRKHLNRWRDKPVFESLMRDHSDKYFAVALQVYNDSQVTSHSPYHDVRDFIKEVVASFAASAQSDHHLVFKHHPMDRGQRDYRRLLNSLSQEHGIEGKVHYVHDVHLPTLLRNSRGVITINSTVGLSTLYHDKPLMLMGRALYDLAGLTFQGELAQFWSARTRVDKVLWRRFRAYLITQTQLNGAFHGRDFHVLENGPERVVKAKLSAPLVVGSARQAFGDVDADEGMPQAA